MSRTIDIAPNAAEVLVIALSMSAPEAKALRDPATLAARLGAPLPHPERTEIVALRDITALGLPAYLHEGYDVEPGADATRLAALDGHALIIRSGAFGSAPTTLTPDPALTLIARLAEQSAPPASLDTLRSAGAHGTLTPSGESAYGGDHHASRRTLVIGLLSALVLLAVVVLAIRFAA